MKPPRPLFLLGIVAKRQLAPGSGAVLEVLQWGQSSTLLYTTQRGGVGAWDLRTKGVGRGASLNGGVRINLLL